MANSVKFGENPLREANTHAREALSILIQRVQKPSEPQQKVAAPRVQIQTKKK